MGKSRHLVTGDLWIDWKRQSYGRVSVCFHWLENVPKARDQMLIFSTFAVFRIKDASAFVTILLSIISYFQSKLKVSFFNRLAE